MNRVIGLTALVCLSATSALSQETPYDSLEVMAIDSANVFPVLLTGDPEHPLSAELTYKIRNAFERSRELELVETPVDAARVVAPTRLVTTETAQGKRLQVTYDVNMPRSNTTTHVTSCETLALDDCARSVVAGAERLVREHRRIR